MSSYRSRGFRATGLRWDVAVAVAARHGDELVASDASSLLICSELLESLAEQQHTGGRTERLAR